MLRSSRDIARTAAAVWRGRVFKVVNYDVIHRDLDVINQWGPDLII